MLDAWEVFAEQLTISDTILGKGKFGEVFGAVLQDQAVAVKTLREDADTEEGRRNFLREADIMKVIE